VTNGVVADSGLVDLPAAARVLTTGGALVVPNPAPLTCVITASSPEVVNRAKRRRPDRPVALWLHDDQVRDGLKDLLDLTHRQRSWVFGVLEAELVTMLLPVRADVVPPAWLTPATRNGWTMVFGTRWPPVLPALRAVPLLYVSSANPTGCIPAASPAEAKDSLSDIAILDVPTQPTGPRAATTTLRVGGDGKIELHRAGAQDRGFPNGKAYLVWLAERYGQP
jgi:tRNA A37 threonylcarbamoyladenosine synthetase subunit TsaC/SUA5/YrdC